MNWISYLLNGVKSNNLQWKMNRNLYAIKLLDNVINNKLDEPFWTLPLPNKELPMLSLVKVKEALTDKFHKEISYKKIEEKGIMLYNTLTKNIDYIEKFELNQIMLETIVYQLKQRKEEQKIIIEEQRKEIIGEPKNLEEQAISLVGRDIFEKLVKGYTEKQWGRDCKELPAFIIKRLPVRFTYDNNYFNDRYQGIPMGGYNIIIEK